VRVPQPLLLTSVNGGVAADTLKVTAPSQTVTAGGVGEVMPAKQVAVLAPDEGIVAAGGVTVTTWFQLYVLPLQSP